MIIMRLMGGLGNQMFQYALGRHLSLKNNKKLYLDISGISRNAKEKNTTQREYDLSKLNIQTSIYKKNKIEFSYTLSGLIKFYREKKIRKYPYQIIQERGIRDIIKDRLGIYGKRFTFKQKIEKIQKDSYFIGFWQSYKYFENERTILIKDFEPKAPINKKNSELLTAIQKKTSVSIHIRRGDYNDTYHGFCSTEYYKIAMKHIQKKHTNLHFFVFSNDINRCKKQFGEKKFTYVDCNTGTESYRDLILMSKCNHNIIANSSFSWRAARLNTSPNKIVIAPKKRFKVNIDTNDLIPKEWIRI